jgi:heme/copper-type cytochrome/quinol oxidase subunit 3
MTALATLPASSPAPPLPRRRGAVYGAAFAGAFWAMVILTLVGAYLSDRSVDRVEWLKKYPIPLTQPNMQFGALVLSIFMAHWALYAIRRNARGHAYLALGITIVLGLAFLNQTWFLLTQVAMPLSATAGPSFYSVVGVHAAMAAAAILFLAAVGVRALGGNFNARYPDGVTAAVVFWDIMVALYSVVWLAVYITK